MKRRSEGDIYDKILVGAILMLAAEMFAPIPLVGPILQIFGMVL
jgi:K+-transporting ATPase A subunit